MDLIILSILVVEVAVLSRLDKKLFGTCFTPFNLLSYPYTAIALVAFFFAPRLDFVALYAPSVVIWIVGLFVFWGTGALIGLAFIGPVTGHEYFCDGAGKTSETSFIVKLATRLAWGIAPLLAYGFYKSESTSGGLAYIGSPDFRTAYQYGISAHAVVLAVPLSVLLIGTYRKGQKLQFITIAVLLTFLFVSQVKGTLLVPIAASLIFRAIRANSKVPLKKIVAGILLSYVLFNAVYLAGLSLADPSILQESDTYIFLARHYFYYLSGGVLALGEALRTGVGTVGGPWYLVFTPFMNLYRALMGSGHLLLAGSPRELGMTTDLLSSTDLGTNVYTMFGTLYLYLGPIDGATVSAVFSFICYGLLVICKSRSNVWLLTLYCIFGGWLVMGFFEYYFWSLSFLEITVDCAILAAISRWVPISPRSIRSPQPQSRPAPCAS